MLPKVDDIGRFAIFLDFDGTIAELAERPDDVRVEPPTMRLLENLVEATEHALAIVSGRDIAVVDRMLHPLVLPVAGVHGLQRRDATGRLHGATAAAELAPVIEELRVAVAGREGLLVELKTGAAALHYRLRPESKRFCREIVENIMRHRPDLELLEGKMVFEIKLGGADKGDVIEAFLAERPFVGRRPIFAGDDLTDEVGFAVVNARGGVSIKVGANATLARFRAADLHELHAWLDDLAREARKERAI